MVIVIVFASPEEMVKVAKAEGFSALAISDHDAATAYPDAAFERNPVAVVTEDGRRGLRLSHGTNAEGTFTFLAVPGKVFQTYKTMFVVSRQIDSSWYGSIIGRVIGYDDRYNRLNSKGFAWAKNWGGQTFINGYDATDADGDVSYGSYGGVATPHVLATQSGNGADLRFETVGAAFVMTPPVNGKFYNNDRDRKSRDKCQ